MKALFLYNPNDLNAKIVGGVQICSQQYLTIIKETADQVNFLEVSFSKSLWFRILHKLNLDAYLSYQPKKYKQQLIDFISEKEISHVFINKAELIKFSQVIKESSLEIKPKVIIMSHGNESGDFLGDLAGKKPQFKGIAKLFGILKLGLSVYRESWHRQRYIDLVCTMSEEEMAIEKWFGINNPIFIPRLIDRNLTVQRKPTLGIFGYVGTLNHSPNINALYQLCEKIAQANIKPEIRIVGGPRLVGEQLAHNYSFVKYLGALTDGDLLAEVKEWAFFINPIFNYSRGASMKLGKAIEWEIPVITTIAGQRGYFFERERLIETDNTPLSMANKIVELTHISEKEYQGLVQSVLNIKHTAVSANELGKMLREKLNILTQ